MDGVTCCFQRLVDLAKKAAAKQREVIKLLGPRVGSDAIAENTELCSAVAAVEAHLKRVVNRGQRVELHVFPGRPLTPTEQMFLAGAKQYQEDGQLEFDECVVVSEGSDPGAYVLGWQWIYFNELKFPLPFEAEVKYQPQQHDGSPSGEQLLAIDQCLAFTEDEARQIFMDRHWDDRLDAAGCVPIVNFADLSPDLETWYYCEDPEETDNQIDIKARNAPEALQIIQLLFPDATLEQLSDQDWETK